MATCYCKGTFEILVVDLPPGITELPSMFQYPSQAPARILASTWENCQAQEKFVWAKASSNGMAHSDQSMNAEVWIQTNWARSGDLSAQLLKINYPTVTLCGLWDLCNKLCQAVQAVSQGPSFLAQLGCAQQAPTIVFEDNWACIYMSKNTVLHHKTKHIDVWVYHLCYLVCNKIMTLLKIGTHYMVADTLTKALPNPAFVSHHSVMLNDWSGTRVVLE
eukprot:1994155-Rhodomonas_salina.1